MAAGGGCRATTQDFETNPAKGNARELTNVYCCDGKQPECLSKRYGYDHARRRGNPCAQVFEVSSRSLGNVPQLLLPVLYLGSEQLLVVRS